MKRRFVVKSRVDADIDAALRWYSKEAPEQVSRLLAVLKTTLASIKKAPALGSPRYAHELDLPGLRTRMTKNFPYLVFYLEQASAITVLRVLHVRRDIPDGLDP